MVGEHSGARSQNSASSDCPCIKRAVPAKSTTVTKLRRRTLAPVFAQGPSPSCWHHWTHACPTSGNICHVALGNQTHTQRNETFRRSLELGVRELTALSTEQACHAPTLPQCDRTAQVACFAAVQSQPAQPFGAQGIFSKWLKAHVKHSSREIASQHQSMIAGRAARGRVERLS